MSAVPALAGSATKSNEHAILAITLGCRSLSRYRLSLQVRRTGWAACRLAGHRKCERTSCHQDTQDAFRMRLLTTARMRRFVIGQDGAQRARRAAWEELGLKTAEENGQFRTDYL